MFDFSKVMHQLIFDIAKYSPDFSHIRPEQMLVGLSQARSSRRHGMYAKIVSMRFENGSLYTKEGRKTYEVERLHHKGREILYIVYFVLPRFQNLDFNDKMTTIFHELYHISPYFDGDIRRFSGTKYAHSCRQSDFDDEASRMADRYLAQTPNKDLTDFLQIKFRKLKNRHTQIVGQKVPIPKLLPVIDPVPVEENGQLVLVY